MSEKNGKKDGSGPEEQSPPGEDTMNGATGRYAMPNEDVLSLKKFREKAEKLGWIKSFAAGEWVFHAGQVPDEFWLIAEGQVAQYRGDTHVNVLSERKFLGIRAFHLQIPHVTSAQVVVPSVLIKIGGEFYQGMLSYPGFVDATIRQQEEEILQTAKRAEKYRVESDGLRRDSAILQRSLDQYEKGAVGAPRDVRASMTERVLRLLCPDLEEADRLVTTLLSSLSPAVQKELRNSKEYGQLVAVLTRCWNRVRPFTFLRK
ncbi:MAG: cyclic nucleotide-binding domain-containing protein [Patescibacteria group bacterium]